MGRWRERAGLAAILAVVVGGAGVAAAVPGSPLRTEAPTALATANVGTGVALAEQTTTTITAATSVRATPVTPTTAATTTTRLTPATGASSVPTTVRTTTPPSRAGFTTTTVAPGQPPQTVPRPVNPRAWAFEDQGLSVRVTMTPIAPRLGDTVQFTIESWTDVPGLMCCNVTLGFSGDIVFRRWQEIPGPCPETPPREDRVTYRITEPVSSPIPQPDVTVLFLLRVVSSFNPCAGPQDASRSIDVGVPVVIRMPGS